MAERNLATVRRFWDSINRRDIEGYLACFTEDGVAHDPADRPPLRTAEDRRAFMEGLLGNFAELEATIDFVTPCGDHSAAKWTANAKTASGEGVRVEGIDVYRHAPDGRVKEMWGYFQM